eukprot:ANDGO_03667.mRNA.1 putative E3 ubiquitin-protein ligase LOG2
MGSSNSTSRRAPQTQQQVQGQPYGRPQGAVVQQQQAQPQFQQPQQYPYPPQQQRPMYVQQPGVPPGPPGQPGRQQMPMQNMQNPQFYLMFGGTPIIMSGQRPPSNVAPQQFFYAGNNGQYQRPMPPPPQVQQTITIRNDVNLKKASLKILPLAAGSSSSPSSVPAGHASGLSPDQQFGILEFVVDAARDFSVSIFFAAVESVQPDRSIVFTSQVSSTLVPSQVATKGLNVLVTQSSQVPLNLSLYPHDLLFEETSTSHPIVIVLQARDDGVQVTADSSTIGSSTQCQITYATLFEDARTNTVQVRVTKQKIVVQGRSYELQEIYGMDEQEAAPADGASPASAESSSSTKQESTGDDDESSMCVICMSEKRDTAVLPCRHMCLCSDCAKVLRLQTNKCPICRSTIDSLLHIKFNREGSSSSSNLHGETPGNPSS